MSNNTVNFKVFLRDESSTEARRFVVEDASVVTSFLFMKEKLQMIFPKLRDVNFRITWKDSDGDEITIDSDEDLITAFTEMNGALKVLYITILERKPNQENFQAGEGQFHGFRGRVICDVCENPITGYRYKCMQCPDYDLCSNCEFEGHHSEHMMLRTSRLEFPFARCSRKIMDHINKSMKKVNHMAYKEACRAGKYRGKYEKMWDGRRRCHPEGEQQEQPQTSQQNEFPESSTQQQDQEQRPSGCPMQDINFEQFTPLIYPILDALNNTVTTATAEPGDANNANNTNSSSNNNHYSAGANPQQPHFMDLIRNAINGFFEGAAAQAQQQHQQNQQMPESSNAPTSAAATSSQATSSQQEPRNIPMEVEREIDLTKSPSHSTDFNSRREPGWTLINNQSQSESPRPTAPNPTDRENAKIAEGLKQLLDMGFSDELNLVALLKRFDGNVGEVVKYLFEHNI